MGQLRVLIFDFQDPVPNFIWSEGGYTEENWMEAKVRVSLSPGKQVGTWEQFDYRSNTLA